MNNGEEYSWDLITYKAILDDGKPLWPSRWPLKKLEERKQIISSQTSEEINSMLRKVVSLNEGTANFADIEGYEVGGKTGTSQVVRIKEEDREDDLYKTKKIEDRFKDHSVFVGYAPIDELINWRITNKN